MAFYLLGLGSNIDPDTNLQLALSHLARHWPLTGQSPAIASEAVGDTFSANFRNQLAIIESQLCARDLKEELLAIEEQLGREPKSLERRHRDRPIDIDILDVDADPWRLLQEPLEESYYEDARLAWRQPASPELRLVRG